VTTDGESAVAVFVHGVDLDVVPFAIDVAYAENLKSVVVAARDRDITPSIRRMAQNCTVPVKFVELSVD
jgi:hypothetical protein